MTENTYQVIARKWRPQRFDELVGQKHVARTLRNTVTQNRVGHAYLFVGPRGTGKTTTARIFAKLLNCEAPTRSEPCCECRSCREIARSASLDVIEIDGASHNKVDDIRDIRENVIYTPSRSRYKIYIIDEVHMLSNAAWNALLKTLEEPPEHVKFLFATTEPHKVLPTVLSRCQRFDLAPIPVPLIAGRLRHIADTEGVRIDERALGAIARAADGAMRDAQSIFDQIIAFCGGSGEDDIISEQDVIDVFGLTSGRELNALTAAMLENDVAQILHIIQRLADQGRDLERLYTDLVTYLRNVMVVTTCPEGVGLLDVSESEQQDLKKLAGSRARTLVTRLLDVLVTGEVGFRNALNKRVSLEVALVRAMRDAHSLQIDDLIAGLKRLKQDGGDLEVKLDNVAVDHSAAPGVPAASPGKPPVVAEDAAETAEKAGADEASPGQRAVMEAASGPEPDPEPLYPPQDRTGESEQIASPPRHAAEPDEARSDRAEPPKAEALVEPVQPNDESEFVDTALAMEERDDDSQMDASRDEDGPDPLPADPDETPDEPGMDNAADPVEIWQSVLGKLRSEIAEPQLRACLASLKPVSVIGNALEVAYTPETAAEQVERLDDELIREKLNQVMKQVTGRSESRVLLKKWIDNLSGDESDEPKRAAFTSDVRERLESRPFVRNVCDLFGGTLIDGRGKKNDA